MSIDIVVCINSVCEDKGIRVGIQVAEKRLLRRLLRGLLSTQAYAHHGHKW
jgi:hypothetical protein